jgi:hypothetical protein
MEEFWEEFWTFKITALHVFLLLVGPLVGWALVAGLKYLGRLVLRYAPAAWAYLVRGQRAGRRAIRRVIVREISRRVTSDEFFAARQRIGLMQLMLIFTVGILAVLFYGFSVSARLPGTWAAMGLAMIVVEYVVIGSATLEQWYYKRALHFRLLRERRKSLAQRRGGRTRRRGSPRASVRGSGPGST